MSGYSSVQEDPLAVLPAVAGWRPTLVSAGATLRALLRPLDLLRPVERIAVVGHGTTATLPHDPPGRRRAVRRRVESVAEHEVGALAASGALDRVLIAVGPADAAARAAVLAELSAVDVAVDLVDELFDVQPVRSRAIGRVGRFCKSACDRFGAGLLLLLLGPMMLLIALAIRCGDRGPVLFRQMREGLHGTAFTIIKFRTMREDVCFANGPVVQTARADRRVTPVGRILRATSLDELPQLVNVLRGEMSLVGPRPHPKLMLTGSQMSEEIVPNYHGRHRVRPGMTGWAQVNGSRGGLATADALRRRVSLDLDYIERWSLLLDLRIVLLTPLRLVFHGGTAF